VSLAVALTLLRHSGGNIHPEAGVATRFCRMPEIVRQELAVESNKDRVEGGAKETAGNIPEESGESTDITAHRARGAINKTVGAGLLRLADVAERARKANQKR
jgi:uncharacterized protein YjbJ (UPF0337 family)